MVWFFRMGRYGKDFSQLYRSLRDPEFRAQQIAESQQKTASRLRVGRWIFVLVAAGLAFLWVMNALGHPV